MTVVTKYKNGYQVTVERRAEQGSITLMDTDIGRLLRRANATIGATHGYSVPLFIRYMGHINGRGYMS